MEVTEYNARLYRTVRLDVTFDISRHVLVTSTKMIIEETEETMESATGSFFVIFIVIGSEIFFS